LTLLHDRPSLATQRLAPRNQPRGAGAEVTEGEVQMMVMRVSVLLSALLILVGCAGPRVPVKKIDGLPLEERRAVLGLPIYNETQLVGKNYTVINLVEGISCKNKTWDPPATKTDAVNQAKYWAREQVAEGVMNFHCDLPRRTTTSSNCWESITCTGQAIKFNAK
jgi:hypothetical protein